MYNMQWLLGKETFLKKDVTWSTFFEDEERFADFVNCFGCNGLCFVSKKDISSEDTREHIVSRIGGNKTPISRMRDVIRRVAFGTNFCIIGIENQEMIDYGYPLREMSYTVATYEKQRRAIGRKYRKRKRESKDLSGMLYGYGKIDRLRPSVTFLLYSGEREWDGANDLQGMLDFTDFPDALREKVQNYRINLIEIRNLQEEQLSELKTDIAQVFRFIKYSGDKDALLELVERDAFYREMDEESYDVICNYSQASEFIHKEEIVTEGGKYNMCKAIMDLMEDSRIDGIEIGRIESLQESILDFLNDIGNIDSGLEEIVRSQCDEAVLKQWMRQAARANSISEFEKKIDLVY